VKTLLELKVLRGEVNSLTLPIILVRSTEQATEQIDSTERRGEREKRVEKKMKAFFSFLVLTFFPLRLIGSV
jgi:hypothetical protein